MWQKGPTKPEKEQNVTNQKALNAMVEPRNRTKANTASSQDLPLTAPPTVGLAADLKELKTKSYLGGRLYVGGIAPRLQSTMPSKPFKNQNCSASKALVKASANCRVVSTFAIPIRPDMPKSRT